MKYIAAHQQGKFEHEIIPVEYTAKKQKVTVTQDENVRPDTSLEKLAQLKTVFREGGTVTAGNASGLNDGAAAMILASAKAVKEYGLKPIARIITAAVAGVHPDIMGTGPVPATRKALQLAGLTIDDIDLFEINEAYAVQVIYCTDELGLDKNKVNVNGGAVAIGHPLGCSGARITGHLAYELKRRNAKYGLATMCVGVGQGTAIIIENLNNE
jgi:acetyl-CoA acetyltransferase family protein